jgi:hypothetical protein
MGYIKTKPIAWKTKIVCGGIPNNIPYLRESSAHPFRGFLGPKTRVRIRIDGALDAHTKSETTISLSVGLL